MRGRPTHSTLLTFHGVFIGLLGILNVKDLSHLLNDLSTEMGRQSVGGGWECIEADLPTALGGGKKLTLLRQQMTNEDFAGGPVVKNPLLIQGTWVRSLVQEDSTCHRATKPIATPAEPHMLQLLKPIYPRACAPQ